MMFTSSTIRMNIRLVGASQFLQLFYLIVRHKSGKEHIISGTLSRLASANKAGHNPDYSKLNTLFVYHTTLVEINQEIVKRILDGYASDSWWAKIHKQVLNNKKLGVDKAFLPFVLAGAQSSESDPYFQPRPRTLEGALPEAKFILSSGTQPTIIEPCKSKLIFYLDCLTGVCHLCISPTIALKLLAIAHGEEHPSFSCCQKIISQLWFIQRLTKLLRSFICHCAQCLTFQTRRYALYGSLQPILLPPMPFFTLTLDFVLVLPLNKKSYNILMSVTYKFSKRVTLIEVKDTFIAKKWGDIFLTRLDLIDCVLLGELISKWDLKFLSKFWTSLTFQKIGGKIALQYGLPPLNRWLQ